MSISSSLSNALSGLSAAARGAEVISANVANALTEGYGKRELTLSAHSLGSNGAGVAVVGVLRSVDQQTISERRIVEASTGQNIIAADFFSALEGIAGIPDEPGSLTGRLAQFEATLIEAASRPDSETRLTAVATAAESLTNKFNDVSEKIQSLRMDADQEISRQVASLNDGLEKIAALNFSIRKQIGAGHDASAFMDQRQTLIDGLSSIVPIHEIARDNGLIALFTSGGAILLDGKAAELSFSPAGIIVPEMTLGTGALSSLLLNGQPVNSTVNGALSGGSLSGLFSVRDSLSVSAQQQLDSVARDLIERFSDPTVDPTLSPSDPGLFTDANGVFLPTAEVGLSARLSLNSIVNPTLGGAVWKIRDGIGAVVQGSVGDASNLQSLVATLTDSRLPASGAFIGAARSASGLAAEFLSLINTNLQSAQAEQSFSSAQFEALKNIELQSGVDTDAQLQGLLLIEQAYTANARVITTIDQMIQTILEL